MADELALFGHDLERVFGAWVDQTPAWQPQRCQPENGSDRTEPDGSKDDRWFAGEQSASDQVWQGTVHNDEWDLGLDDAGGHAQVVGGGVGHGLASFGRVLSGVDRSWVFG